MVTIPTHKAPTHPGEMLLEEFLKPLELTQTELAKRIGVPFQRINGLVNARHGITPDMALRLSRAFGTSPAFWMNHQLRWELFQAQRVAGNALARIERITGAGAT
jgi:antitoxin HigA-1